MEERIQETERPFEFRQCITILKSTGIKAANLKELRQIIATVSDDSIFHHTYQYFLKEHILEYTNDFAHWAGESLEERAVAEELSNIDPYGCGTYCRPAVGPSVRYGRLSRNGSAGPPCPARR